MKQISFIFLVFLLVNVVLKGQTLHTIKPQIISQSTTPESAGFSSERLKRIDNNIQEWTKDPRFNGCVAMIVHNGKIVYNKAFGYDDLARTKPLKADDIYRIASQTKAITSVAIMMLYEEGKFLLDDPISKYIPEFAKQKVIDKFNAIDTTYTTVDAKSEVTIRQLLTHTSGISYPQIGSPQANAIYAKAKLIAGIGVEHGRSLKQDVMTIAKLPLMHQPGELFTYGFNTDILGYMVELFSGMSLDQFFKSRIFEPLGMKDTYFYLPKSKHERLVSLMEERGGKLVKSDTKFPLSDNLWADYPLMENTYYSGGAGLSSTAIDYAIFLQMMLNEGTYNGKRLLSRNTIRMMLINQIGEINFGDNKFGLGFGITTEKGSTILPTPEGVFEWGGAFSTTYWADPKENLIGIFYRQIWGGSMWDVATKFKVLAYQALE